MKSKIVIGVVAALFAGSAATASPMNCCKDCCKHMSSHHMSKMHHK